MSVTIIHSLVKGDNTEGADSFSMFTLDKEFAANNASIH